MSVHLGFYNTATTRTHVGFQFSTMASAGGNVAPSSAIDAADIRIYRAADGAAFSATQRSSSSGITCTSPFDSLTGFHDVDIDLTDNTDSGFYASGYRYSVVLAPNDETIDSLVITGVVLAYFEIGIAKADVTQFGGTNGTFSGGRPEVNATHWGGTAVASANVLIDGAITAAKIGTDAITDAKVASDVTIASVTGAVGSVTGNVGGNVVGSVASVTGNVGGNVVGSVGSVTSGVTVTTNNDKTGYSLSASAIQAIWDALTSALSTVGSVGKLLVDNINATISSRSSHTAANVRTEIDSNSTQLATILADTNELQTDWANGGRLDLLLDAILADTGTDGVVVAAGSKTGYSLSPSGLDAVLVESGISAGADLTNDSGTQLTSINARQAMALFAAALEGVLAGAATTTITIKPAGKPSGNTRVSAVVDANGNRTALTLKVPD